MGGFGGSMGGAVGEIMKRGKKALKSKTEHSYGARQQAKKADADSKKKDDGNGGLGLEKIAKKYVSGKG